MKMHPGIDASDFGRAFYGGTVVPGVGIQGGDDHPCTDCGRSVDGEVHLLLKDGHRCVCFGCRERSMAVAPAPVRDAEPRRLEPVTDISKPRRAPRLF